MKKVSHDFYKCSICGEEYGTEKDALECERRPISKDAGIKVGDKVMILSGDGAGEIAVVESKWIYDKYWGHYAWERYWHTPGYNVKHKYWNRTLTWDSIEKV